MGDPHLSERQLASYLDKALTSPERAAVEAHLEACDDCRAELFATARLASTLPAPRRRWLVAAVAAAAIAAVVVLVPGRKQAGDVIRGPNDGEGIPRVQAVMPLQDSRVPQSALRFTWHALPTAELYRVTLTDVGGAVLWSDSTSDTTAVPQARLDPGKTYYWVVDALLADGRSATTGSIGFSAMP